MMQKYIDWMNAKVKKMDWLDMGCTKWASALFGIILAKLWPPILSLDWYWYVAFLLVLLIRPMMKVFSK